ncbi:MAG TPA: HEAT repeat domain-containing protein [Candidatus Wallbacteria bacterium]|nr:MAG: hypothetical protein BWY32_02889 [bacterium ADurb.Bin243]HPG57639.1 HEAT repeat domain-containing protein [Candidatus Wallbacteria bacterium]
MSVSLEEIIFELESDIDDSKIKAARILAQAGDASALPHLEKQLNSANQTVRYFVKKAIDAIKIRGGSAGTAPQQPAAPQAPPPAQKPPVTAQPDPLRTARPAEPPAPKTGGIPIDTPPAEEPVQTRPAPMAPPVSNARVDISDSELLQKLSKLPEDKKIAELARVFEEGDYDLLDNVVVSKIAELAGAEANPDVAGWYLRLVGKYGGQPFLSGIARYLKSPNPKHISAALDALFYIKDKNLVNIIPQFIRHPDKEVQSSAIAALWANDYEKSKQILDKMLNADEREYRFIAARSILKIPDDKSMEMAMAIFYNEEDPEIFKIGVLGIQKKTNESNYYKLKEIIDTLPSQKANFIRQIIDKFDAGHHVEEAEVVDSGTEITIDIQAEEEKEKERLRKITSAKADMKKGAKGQPAEVFTEKDIEIDINNLKPVPILMTEIGSKKESERIKAIKMLIAHLKKGASGELKEQILFAIELAAGDVSQKVRELVAEALKGH